MSAMPARSDGTLHRGEQVKDLCLDGLTWLRFADDDVARVVCHFTEELRRVACVK